MAAQDPAPWAPTSRPDLGVFVPRERRLTPLLVWLGCLAGALLLLVWLGDGRLAAPDLAAPSSWGAWVRDLGPGAATMALLRIVALGLAWYLVGVTAVSVVAHAVEAAGLVRVADALAVGPVRSVVQQALGIGLAVGVVMAAVPAEVAATADEAAGSTLGDDEHDGEVAGAGTAARAGLIDEIPRERPPVATPASADARPAQGAGDATSLAPVPGPVAPPAADLAGDVVSAARATAPPDVSSPLVIGHRGGTGASATPGSARGAASADRAVSGTVLVTAGDHLWGIAEADLVETLGRQPTEAEVAAHWRQVIARNADRLVVATNPDLLLPGQEIVLPEVEVGR